MRRRSKNVSLLGAVMILSLWAISVGMIASGVASDLETLRLPV
ncbi:hypothetical protein [Streptomyces clavuligerus]|uniref:Uncharacterized protein n=1 Tax=Streptomyces clavuligerus TaxID=1901 RepID=B5GNH1_STRCL|nr:hypothetical protein [Streptomyces clavuligerus]EDY47960.1 hypothetical protein SSCG_00988 [Streptomyces clavuligerus]EFG08473.1 Hypothetical protein SCLAV_3402 [Streptomyces clavuligerus]